LNRRQVTITLDDKALDFLVSKGDQPEFGARPIRRMVEENLEAPLSEKILTSPEEGRHVLVSAEADKLTFTDLEVFPLRRTEAAKAAASAPQS
jgi:ATP-dependent Clp protease ATP-binding subunit ClpA